VSAGPGCRVGPPERMVAMPKPYPADCRRDVVAIARKGEAPLSQIAKVYFCDPRSPWQRGTNENTTGLLRQYLPKTRDLSDQSQEHLDTIALRPNTRPRKTLGFITPAAKLRAAVASSGWAHALSCQAVAQSYKGRSM
jgi:hypothetical protein